MTISTAGKQCCLCGQPGIVAVGKAEHMVRSVGAMDFVTIPHEERWYCAAHIEYAQAMTKTADFQRGGYK